MVVVVVVVCVCVGGGDEAISKLKGAGQRMPSHAHTCMCPYISLRLVPHKSFVQHIGEATQK